MATLLQAHFLNPLTLGLAIIELVTLINPP